MLWSIDSDHLGLVSEVWDLSVFEFRSELVKYGLDDSSIAALQDAMNDAAYEHFVAEGMRHGLACIAHRHAFESSPLAWYDVAKTYARDLPATSYNAFWTLVCFARYEVACNICGALVCGGT